MKVTARSVESFLRSPGSDIRVALFFGPDHGMVTERARILGSGIVDDLNDPFSVIELSESDLKDDPVRLGDEARAMSFGGGRRLIRVRGAGESTGAALKTYLEHVGDGSLVVIEAGELTPRSALRSLCEKDDRCAAIGCYPEQGGDLAGTVRQALADAGLHVERDAIEVLVRHLAEDRGVVRREIEKLALFAGENGALSTQDVMACLTDAAAVSLDRLVFACGDGDAQSVDALSRRALDEGVSEIAVLRALQQHFMRLEWVAAQGGDAVSRLRPPIFYQFKDRFQRQARTWKLPAIRRALATLTEAEIGCKSSGEPAALICGRAVLAVTSWAPKKG